MSDNPRLTQHICCLCSRESISINDLCSSRIYLAVIVSGVLVSVECWPLIEARFLKWFTQVKTERTCHSILCI